MTVRELICAELASDPSAVVAELWKELNSCIKCKGVLDKDPIDASALSKLRNAIHTVIKRMPFEDQPETVCIINQLFASNDIEWHDSQNSSRICKIDQLFDSTETDVRLLRYLQGGEAPAEGLDKSRIDIAEEFGVSKNTIDKHFQSLTDGCNILGSNVQIALRRGATRYDSTIHPFFLALNLSEVYLLMVAIRQAVQDKPIKSAYLNILADMYRQLSPYARQKVDYFAARDGIDLFDGREYSDFDRGYRRESYEDLHTLAKSGMKCRIQFVNEIPRERRGFILCRPDHFAIEFIDSESEECIRIDDEKDIYFAKGNDEQIPT